MTRIEAECVLPAEPERIWQLISEPEEMNRWSEATISWLGSRTRRRVTLALLGLRMVLEEEIVEAEPPRRLVYRVVAGGGLRTHRGVQTLERVGHAATRLHWEVTFVPRLPGSGPLLRWLLLPKLERSLAALARISLLPAVDR